MKRGGGGSRSNIDLINAPLFELRKGRRGWMKSRGISFDVLITWAASVNLIK